MQARRACPPGWQRPPHPISAARIFRPITLGCGGFHTRGRAASPCTNPSRRSTASGLTRGASHAISLRVVPALPVITTCIDTRWNRRCSQLSCTITRWIRSSTTVLVTRVNRPDSVCRSEPLLDRTKPCNRAAIAAPATRRIATITTTTSATPNAIVAGPVAPVDAKRFPQRDARIPDRSGCRMPAGQDHPAPTPTRRQTPPR